MLTVDSKHSMLTRDQGAAEEEEEVARPRRGGHCHYIVRQLVPVAGVSIKLRITTSCQRTFVKFHSALSGFYNSESYETLCLMHV